VPEVNLVDYHEACESTRGEGPACWMESPGIPSVGGTSAVDLTSVKFEKRLLTDPRLLLEFPRLNRARLLFVFEPGVLTSDD